MLALRLLLESEEFQSLRGIPIKVILSSGKGIKISTPFIRRYRPKVLLHITFLVLTLWKTTGSLFCRPHLNAGLLRSPHDLIHVPAPLARIAEKFCILCIKWHKISMCPIAEDVPLDRLTKVVSARLLHCKVTTFIFAINKYSLNLVNNLIMIKFPRYAFIFHIRVSPSFPIFHNRLQSFAIIYFDVYQSTVRALQGLYDIPPSFSEHSLPSYNTSVLQAYPALSPAVLESDISPRILAPSCRMIYRNQNLGVWLNLISNICIKAVPSSYQ